jgi:hypothetical protein
MPHDVAAREIMDESAPVADANVVVNQAVARIMKGAIATARMRGQRVHLIQHQWMSSFLVTRSRSGGRRRQSRTVMWSPEDIARA